MPVPSWLARYDTYVVGVLVEVEMVEQVRTGILLRESFRVVEAERTVLEMRENAAFPDAVEQMAFQEAEVAGGGLHQ